MLTDLLATFAENPLGRRYGSARRGPARRGAADAVARGRRRASSRSAHAGAGFAFDNERPRHRALLDPFALAGRPSPMPNGSASSPTAAIRPSAVAGRRLGLGARGRHRGAALLARGGRGWSRFGLDGASRSTSPTPVCAHLLLRGRRLARWAGARLPTEAEWESAAADHDPLSGNQLDAAGPVRPRPPAAAICSATSGNGPAAPFFPIRASPPPRARSANITASSCAAQLVLRGGSCATPRGHSAPPTATSSTRISAGCSPGFALERVTS